MKNQALFSSKDKSKKLKCRLQQFLFGALRVNCFCTSSLRLRFSLLITRDLAVSLDRRQKLCAILLDFSKAFEKVPHHRLAVKLHHYDIRDENLS